MELLKRRIEFNNDRLCWCVIGDKGAIHIWCTALDVTLGGIEIHSREPMYDGHKSQEDKCWLIGGKCHHDGSSLQYSERIRHKIGWEFNGEWRAERAMEGLWWMLANEYRSRFDTQADIDWSSRVITDSGKQVQS